MPTVTDPKTGETREISKEEFMAMLRSGEGKITGIQQVVTHPDGTQDKSTIYGSMPGEDSREARPVNVIAAEGVTGYFLRDAITGENGQERTNDSYVISVDSLETPITWVMSVSPEQIELNIYSRDERKSNSQASKHQKWDLNGGGLEVNLEILQQDKLLTFVIPMIQMYKFLKKQGIPEALRKPENAGAYVLMRREEDGVSVRIVRGKERPELPCMVLDGLLGEQMCRPYVDELFVTGMDEEADPDLDPEALEDDPCAMMELAMAYLNGDGMVQDFEKAAMWMEKLARTGDSEAQFNMGLFCAKGCGVPRDFQQAAMWMNRAAENGDPDARVPATMYEKTAEMLERARTGEAEAQAALAKFYTSLGGSLDQFGPGDDYREAFFWAKKAAEQENPEGIWALALCYEHGRGVEADKEAAVEWYRKGAQLGHAPSQHSLGCYYMRGDVVAQDMEQGFTLFLQSAEQGYGLALKDVGRCYQFGNGVQDNMKTAIYWYEKYLETNNDPEMAQKVALFRQLMQFEEEAEIKGAPAGENLPEGYMDALEAFDAQEEEPEVPTIGKTLRYLNAAVDMQAGIATITEEVVGTQYEGRNQRIEYIRVGDLVRLVREPENAHNEWNIAVQNHKGESLGNLSSGACHYLAPLMDAGYAHRFSARVKEVIPVSKRSSRAKKSILKLEITIDFGDMIHCTLCKLGGDQVNIWIQELTVWGCTMPTEHAKLIFELYNRYNGEYDNLDKGENDTSYAGLDNLEEEIRAARQQMQAQRIPGGDYARGEEAEEGDFGYYVCRHIEKEPERYGELKQYGIKSYEDIEEIFWDHLISEQKYHWIDQTRVTEEEFGELDGFNHWYDILELYDGTELPVDLKDEDVVSIFGCGKFAAFADLSYGC